MVVLKLLRYTSTSIVANTHQRRDFWLLVREDDHSQDYALEEPVLSGILRNFSTLYRGVGKGSDWITYIGNIGDNTTILVMGPSRLHLWHQHRGPPSRTRKFHPARLDSESDLQFFEVPIFRNVTLKCINEIGGLELSREYDDKFVILHDMTMASLRRIIPLETGAFRVQSQTLIHL